MNQITLSYEQATELVNRHIVKKDFDTAFSILNELVKLDPEKFEAWFLLGMVSMEIGDKDSATIFFDKALNIFPQLSNYSFKDKLLKQQNKLSTHTSLIQCYAEYKLFLIVDTFIISFPKCGRTWLRLVLGKIITDHFHLEAAPNLELRKFVQLDTHIPCIEFSHDDYPHWKPVTDIVEDKSIYQEKKVALLVRDPRDVVVSYYFQYTKRGDKNRAHDNGYDGDIFDFIFHPIGGIKSIIKFYNIWAKNRHIPKDFILIRYEDLQQDFTQSIKKLLRFIGITNVEDSTIKSAMNYSSFENMKQMEKENSIGSPRLQSLDTSDPESYKVRKGKIGGYKDYLSEKQIAEIDAIVNEHLDDYFSYYKNHIRPG